MELVYLWVEDYKNIHEQDFNFSPRFECSYKNHVLTICDKKEKNNKCKNKSYIENFFGENINVTAIVGENGSGKSNILGYINEYLSKIIQKLGGYKNNLFVLLLEDVVYILTTLDIKIDCSQEYELIIIPKFQMENKIDNSRIKFILEQFSLTLYSFHITSNNKNLQYATKHYPDRRLSPIEIEKNDPRLITYQILEEENESQYFGDFFSPDQIVIQSNSLYDIEITKEEGYKKYFKNISILGDELDKKNNVDEFLFVIYTYLSSLLFRFTPNDTFEELKNVSSLQNFEEILRNKITTLMTYYVESNIVYTNKLNYRAELLSIGEILLDYANKIKKDKEHLEELLGTNKYSNLHYGVTFNINKNKLKNKKEYYYLFEKLPECFEINFRDTLKNIEYLDLSSGEKSVIRVRYYIETEIKKSQKKNFLFLFDELDTEIHPQWQKNIINYLINIFKDREEKFHFVLTTHSPFLLSDLPKENVIFLKEGNQDKTVTIDTFGANIHTLLSHGFFMQEGLMGEFAKEKIQSVIDFLNDKNNNHLDQQKAWAIIQLIGEPFLKYKLEEKFHENYSSDKVKNEAKIKRLEEEIERLKSVKPKD